MGVICNLRSDRIAESQSAENTGCNGGNKAWTRFAIAIRSHRNVASEEIKRMRFAIRTHREEKNLFATTV